MAGSNVHCPKSSMIGHFNYLMHRRRKEVLFGGGGEDGGNCFARRDCPAAPPPPPPRFRPLCDGYQLCEHPGSTFDACMHSYWAPCLTNFVTFEPHEHLAALLYSILIFDSGQQNVLILVLDLHDTLSSFLNRFAEL